MARKPTPAGAAPADTTPPAAEPEAAAPAQATTPEPSPAAAPVADDSATGSDERDPLETGDARVLIAFDEHLPDDIVSGTLAELAVLERDGKVDTHPDAVAYVRSLKA